MKTLYLSAFVILGLMACQSSENISSSPESVLIAEGLSIVESNCASCHAIGATGDSPRIDAPPLRNVLSNYDAISLADDFREHIHVGHADMPDFDFGPMGTDAVLAYLESIQDKP